MNRHFEVEHEQKISLPGCTFRQKDFTHEAQVQISPDAGTKLILMLLYQFLAHQVQARESRTKSQPAKKAQEVLG